jgi:glutaredoxin 3
MNIEIYSKEQCPICDMAERLAQQFVQESEHKFKKFMLGVDFDREKMLEMFPTAKTFPQIKIDGMPIGGYNEFERYIDG